MSQKTVPDGWCDFLGVKDDMKTSKIQQAIDALEQKKAVIQMAIDELVQQTLVERHAKKQPRKTPREHLNSQIPPRKTEEA